MTCPSCQRDTLLPFRAFSGRVLWSCDANCGSVYSGEDVSSLQLEFIGGPVRRRDSATSRLSLQSAAASSARLASTSAIVSRMAPASLVSDISAISDTRWGGQADCETT